jgi:predicted nucleic acid-binding protein
MVVSYYIDTSALFKRYVQEAGTDVLDQIFAEDNTRYISALTLVEIISNLRRLVDVNRLLNEQEFLQIKSTVFEDVHKGYMTLVEVTPKVLATSLDICTSLYVTPVDAIQLATALTLKDHPVFVCSDKKLIRIAEQFKLQTLNPIS